MYRAFLASLCLAAAASAHADPTVGACAAQPDGSTTCPLNVPPPPPTYVLVAREGGTFTLLEAQVVRYGAGDKWVEKTFPAGAATACGNSTFGDPAYGAVKRCEARSGAPVDLTLLPGTQMPSMLDHSMQGVFVSDVLAAAVPPGVGASAPRVRTTWHHKDWSDCAPFTDGCFVTDADKPAGPEDIGAFREPTRFAKFGRIDPIVNAGDPTKAAHPHSFLGNLGISAATTPANIGNCSSTNAGGSLNCSSYWVPTGVDTRTGQPLRLLDSLVYYKGSYEFDISKVVEVMPLDLRVVSGNAMNTNPATASGRFTCFGPDGAQGPTANTIPGALKGGTCKTGGVLQFGVAFPYCWDGVNLDSPNHFSHMSWTETYVAIKLPTGEIVQTKEGTPGSYYGKRCPASHPHVLPVVSYSLSYAITDDKLVENIRFSSDLPGSEAGSSFHGDWWMHWDVLTAQRWVDHCIKTRMDCHAWLLGDGYALY